MRFVSGTDTWKLISRLKTISGLLSTIKVRHITFRQSNIYICDYFQKTRLSNEKFPYKQTRRQIPNESFLQVISKILIKTELIREVSNQKGIKAFFRSINSTSLEPNELLCRGLVAFYFLHSSRFTYGYYRIKQDCKCRRVLLLLFTDPLLAWF